MIYNRIFYKCMCLLLGVDLLSGCIEPFEPKVGTRTTGFLVVDGAINAQGVSVIRLSHTIALNQPTAAASAESKASVYIEQQGGPRYLLKESPAGTYSSPALALAAEQPVRLHFTLARGGEYASEYTPAKHTPAIDSLTWQATGQGVQLAVNAHDETNQARYYRWAYDETWEFTSVQPSIVEFKNNNFVFRLDDIYRCWRSEAPAAIKLGATTKLTQAVVSQQPLTLLPQNSEKLRYVYSILVKQYALSPEEYTYWEALRKNTENIGTLFDPLPTQLTGNVHNVVDPAETVIGFVGAQTVTEKRLFIKREQLPRNWLMNSGYETCEPQTIPDPTSPFPPPKPEEIYAFFSTGLAIPITTYKMGGVLYIVYSTPDCVDCRKRGTNVRPSFWQ